MMLRSMFVCLWFLVFAFLMNQDARLESRAKIQTCGCNVGPLKLPAPVDFLKVNRAETIRHRDGRSAHSCKNYAQHRCRTQTSCEYIGCLGDSLRTGSPGMCCKCWTEAGRGGGGGRQIINYSAPPDKDNHSVSAGQPGKISCLMGSTSQAGI